eukprot:jgi/Bigna1/134079/aug1.23_g8787
MGNNQVGKPKYRGRWKRGMAFDGFVLNPGEQTRGEVQLTVNLWKRIFTLETTYKMLEWTSGSSATVTGRCTKAVFQGKCHISGGEAGEKVNAIRVACHINKIKISRTSPQNNAVPSILSPKKKFRISELQDIQIQKLLETVLGLETVGHDNIIGVIKKLCLEYVGEHYLFEAGKFLKQYGSALEFDVELQEKRIFRQRSTIVPIPYEGGDLEKELSKILLPPFPCREKEQRTTHPNGKKLFGLRVRTY